MNGPRLEARREGSPPILLSLSPEKTSTLGRAGDADLRFPGEPYLSRHHLLLRLSGDVLTVERLKDSSNPVFVGGEAKEKFNLADGEGFVIGATNFRFRAPRVATAALVDGSRPDAERTLGDKDIYSLGGAADRLRDLLELPEVLRSTQDPRALYQHAAGLLRLATSARWVCAVDGTGAILAQDASDDMVVPQLSRTLLAKAAAEVPRPTVWRWGGDGGPNGATVAEGVEWAVCAATSLPDATTIGFYVAGGGRGILETERALADHARFVGLVTDMVGRTVATDSLQTRQKRLQHFFSAPIAAKIIGADEAGALEPRLATGTILFFDLRGFSRKTEESNTNLLRYIGDLRRVMTEMTHIVLDEQGAVLSYIGDAIMACWNLPVEDSSHVDHACRAALRMAAALTAKGGDWRCGIGLHTGEVVAGAIGSDQVFSYGVLGAVVNQASRVEGITKYLETPILVTKDVVDRISATTGVVRRLGRFRPAGMNTAVELFELRPADADRTLDARFAEGLSALESGDWERAYGSFDGLPASDRPARYLKSLAELKRRNAPKSWDGIIDLDAK